MGNGCVIANLKATIGRLRQEIERMTNKAAKGEMSDEELHQVELAKGGNQEDDLGTNHQDGAQDEEEEVLQEEAKKNYQRQAARAN